MSSEPFEVAISVTPEDIDQLGHVNNVVYVRWIQAAAVAHWDAIAPEAEKSRLLWVVLRHEIDYKKPGYLEDEIVVRTWVGESSRFKFERYSEVLRAKDRGVLVKALTVWCPLDATTRRPITVSREVREYFSSGSSVD